MNASDYELAFEMSPVGMVLSRKRMIVDCNMAVAEIFRSSREGLVGQSFQVLYPSVDEFERLGARMIPILNTSGRYSDDRIMKRSDGDLFWCHVNGRALNRADPHEAGIWTFEDLSARKRLTTPQRAGLTGREREVATLLIDGQTSKEIGRSLGLSHRTVDIYRAKLLRKYSASTTAELVQKLIAG